MSEDVYRNYYPTGSERERLQPHNIWQKYLPHGYQYSDVGNAAIIKSFGNVINVRNYPLNDEYTDFDYERAVDDFIAAGSTWALYFPAGDYILHDAVLPLLENSDILVFGDGLGATRITIPATANHSTFLKIGRPRDSIDPTTVQPVPPANFRVFVSGMTIINESLVAGPVFDLDNVADLYFRDIRVMNAAQFFKIGATGRVSRCVYENITGTWNPTLGEPAIYANRAITQRFASMHITSTVGTPHVSPPTDVPAILVEAVNDIVVTTVLDANGDPIVRDLTAVDGWYMENCDVWGAGSGLNHVMVLDATNGNIFNTDWDRHVSDRSSLAGVLIKADAGSAYNVRWMTFRRLRIGTARGIGFHVNNQGNGVFIGIGLENCVVMSETDAAIRVEELNPESVRGFSIDGGVIGDAEEGLGGASPDAGTLRTSLVQMGVSYWTINGLSFTSANVNGFSNYDYAFETIADIDNFVVTGCVARGENVAFFLHYEYEDGGTNIRVENNIGKQNANSSLDLRRLDEALGRLDAEIDIRHPGYRPLRYYLPRLYPQPVTGAASSAGVIYAIRGYIARAVPVRALIARVSTAASAGATMEMAIYSDVNGMPGGLLASVAPIAIDAVGAKTVNLASDLTLLPGAYWFCSQISAAATFFAASTTAPSHASESGVAAAGTLISSAIPTAYSIALTGGEVYGDWPTYLHTRTLTEVTTAVAPVVGFRAASSYPDLAPAFAGVELWVTMVIGQSLSIGIDSDPALSTTSLYPDRVLMPNLGNPLFHRNPDEVYGFVPEIHPQDITDLIPAVEGAGVYHAAYSVETSISGNLNYLAREHTAELDAFTVDVTEGPIVIKLASFVSGGAGKSYAEIRKGTGIYRNMMTTLKQITRIANLKGWRVRVKALDLVHGERDGNIGTSQTEYMHNLSELQGDVSEDSAAITGQTEEVPLILTQPSAWTAGSTEGSSTSVIPQAMLDAHDRYENIHLVGPKYHMTYAGSSCVHIDNTSQIILGQEMALKSADLLFGDGDDVRPTRIVSATRVGDTIDLVYDASLLPILIDDVNVTDPDGEDGIVRPKGFQYKNDAMVTPPAITGVAVLNPTTIRLTLASVPDDTSGTETERVEYAQVGFAGNGGGSNPPVSVAGGGGPRGCVRDSREIVGADHLGAPLTFRPGWAVHQTIEVTV